jgi:hypothetical protein
MTLVESHTEKKLIVSLGDIAVENVDPQGGALNIF